jgi:dihydrofolate reductase
MSVDGFVAGPDQSVENPLGIGGENLHQWVFPLRFWREMQGMAGGEVNASDQLLRESHANIGATIMGRNMFGGHPGPWKTSNPWTGWWGKNPPYHRPVFLITHHPREPLRLEGGNTFNFVTDGNRLSSRHAESLAKRMLSSWAAPPLPMSISMRDS